MMKNNKSRLALYWTMDDQRVRVTMMPSRITLMNVTRKISD
jgi:hypothetical protein